MPGAYMVSRIRRRSPKTYLLVHRAPSTADAARLATKTRGVNDVTNPQTDYPGPQPDYQGPQQGAYQGPQQGYPGPQPGATPPQYGAAAPIAFNPAAVHRLDWAILGAGVLAMLFSFFDYYTFSASSSFYSVSASASAWHGFFGWFGALCAFAAAGVLMVQLLGRLPANVPGRLLTLGGFAAATLCVLLAFLVHPGTGYVGPGFHAGHGFSYWLSLIVIVVGLAASYQRFTADGGVLPWKNRS